MKTIKVMHERARVQFGAVAFNLEECNNRCGVACWFRTVILARQFAMDELLRPLVYRFSLPAMLGRAPAACG
jgi:hypothetical protein